MPDQVETVDSPGEVTVDEHPGLLHQMRFFEIGGEAEPDAEHDEDAPRDAVENGHAHTVVGEPSTIGPGAAVCRTSGFIGASAVQGTMRHQIPHELQPDCCPSCDEFVQFWLREELRQIPGSTDEPDPFELSSSTRCSNRMLRVLASTYLR